MNCHTSITALTPRQLRNFWNAYLAKYFVKISTTCSFDLQNSKQISLLFTIFLIKWYLVSICLVFLWNTWYFDNIMVNLLSQNIAVGSFCSYNKYFNIILIQTTLQVALVVATCSTSAKERVTMGCFLDAHDTIPVPIICVASKVVVSVSNKSEIFWSRIHNSKVFCSIHVSQNYFTLLPMGFFWSFHEPYQSLLLSNT